MIKTRPAAAAPRCTSAAAPRPGNADRVQACPTRRAALRQVSKSSAGGRSLAARGHKRAEISPIRVPTPQGNPDAAHVEGVDEFVAGVAGLLGGWSCFCSAGGGVGDAG